MLINYGKCYQNTTYYFALSYNQFISLTGEAITGEGSYKQFELMISNVSISGFTFNYTFDSYLYDLWISLHKYRVLNLVIVF